MRGKVRREGGREEERKGEEGEVREGGREGERKGEEGEVREGGRKKGKVRKER